MKHSEYWNRSTWLYQQKLLAVAWPCTVCCAWHTGLSLAAESCTGCGVAWLETNWKQLHILAYQSLPLITVLFNPTVEDALGQTHLASERGAVKGQCDTSYHAMTIQRHLPMSMTVQSALIIRCVYPACLYIMYMCYAQSVKLPISRNRQAYCPVREVGTVSAHFANWPISLPISW